MKRTKGGTGTPILRKRKRLTKRIGRWDDSIPRRAYLLALSGDDDQKLAIAFNVKLTTIQSWKREHPTFNKMLMAARQMTKAQAAAAWFKCVIGYHYYEDEVFKVGGKLQVISRRKFRHPDWKAAAKWLAAKDPETWGDKDKTITFKGDPNNPIRTEHSFKIDDKTLDKMSDAELEALENAGIKLLEATDTSLTDAIDVDDLEDYDEDIEEEVEEEVGFNSVICTMCGMPKEVCDCPEEKATELPRYDEDDDDDDYDLEDYD